MTLHHDPALMKDKDCKACGREIGVESYAICLDGITNRQVTFHTRCIPKMTDVQKHNGVLLEPGRAGLFGRDLG